MRRLFRTALALTLAALPGAAASAAEHTVRARPNNTFSPRDLVIEAGDTVTWVNDGGLHNVSASNGSFRCANGCDGSGGDGDPSASAWSFSLVFNDPGMNNYICEVHASIGMVGSVMVNEKTVTEPGTLGFSQSSLQVGEDDGPVTVTVNRTGGTDGTVSVAYSTSNGSAMAGSDYTANSGTLAWGNGDGAVKSFTVAITDDSDDESDETFNVMLMSPTGGAGLGTSAATVTIEDDDESGPTLRPGRLRYASSLFEAGEGDATATISVTRSNGSDGAVSVEYSSTDGSASDGSDYTAMSGTLAWDDGDSATKSFAVEITDDMEIETDETVNLTLSSPTGGATLGSPSSATLTIEDDDAEPGAGCVADDLTLCLGRDDRFALSVVWRDSKGEIGFGHAVDIGKRDSGLFYFFGENNIEMLAKTLDGCSITNHFWVFFAATTDVEFTLTVTDTQAGVTKQYKNPLGNPANAVTDTQAFATCP